MTSVQLEIMFDVPAYALSILLWWYNKNMDSANFDKQRDLFSLDLHQVPSTQNYSISVHDNSVSNFWPREHDVNDGVINISTLLPSTAGHIITAETLTLYTACQ